MHQNLKVKDLIFLKSNPRKITKKGMNKLVESIKNDPDFLKERPILVEKKDDKYYIYAGNQRVRAVKKLGWKEVPCSISENLSEKIKKERIIKDNKTYGEFDFDILASQLLVPKGTSL